MTDEPSTPPLGTVPDGKGVSFALFSREAEKVELCLFDDNGRHETARHTLTEHTGDIWHDWLPRLKAGQRYGYRVYGPYRPENGLRFNPHKLLVDPYARALHGRFAWHDTQFGYTPGHPDADLSFDTRDSAPWVPKSVVTAVPGARERPPRPRIPAPSSIVYELHAKGMTQLHPDVPKRLRGTMAGARPARGGVAPREPRRHHGRAAADPCLDRRAAAGPAQARQLLGLQHARLLRAR